jgi:hypothetical protein
VKKNLANYLGFSMKVIKLFITSILLLSSPTFHPLGDFLNPALALLGQGLKKSPIGQKLDFTNHPYLCKGFI